MNVDWMLEAVRSVRERPSKEEWAMIQALAVSTRGECTRRRVGAVVIDRRGRLAGAGYNGSEPGGPSCLEGGCPRGRHYRWTYAETSPDSDEWEEICRCERPWPCPEAVSPGSSYDTGQGACEAVHAELNAILDVSDASRLEGARVYVTAEPCDGCLKILRTKPLREIVYLDETGATWSLMWPFRR
jgi:dCMP deaminase